MTVDALYGKCRSLLFTPKIRRLGRYCFETRLFSHLLSCAPMERFLSFPPVVSLEMTNRCNLSCIMCPRKEMKRPTGDMPVDMFRELVDQSDGRDCYLLPQGFGESMMHPAWEECMDYLRGKRFRDVIFLTNGMLLTRERGRLLIEVGGDQLFVNVDGATEETYAAIRRGGDLERVRENVTHFLEERKRLGKTGPKLTMRIIEMRENSEEIDAFLRYWRSRIDPPDEVVVDFYRLWTGSVENRRLEPPVPPRRYACPMLWKNGFVYLDGRVTPCCADVNANLVMGNVMGTSLEEIWNGREMRRLRRDHLRGRYRRYPICVRCDDWYFS